MADGDGLSAIPHKMENFFCCDLSCIILRDVDESTSSKNEYIYIISNGLCRAADCSSREINKRILADMNGEDIYGRKEKIL